MSTGPFEIRIVSVQCVTPSAGVDRAAASAFEGIVTSVGSAVAAIAGTVVFTGLTGASYGAATPVALAVGGWIWTAGTAGAFAASVAGTAAANGIGHLMPDQLYITRNNVKIWPAEKFHDIRAGEVVQIGYSMARPKHTIEFELLDWDLVTSDDSLGKVSIPAGEVYINTPMVIKNDEEKSLYIVNITATQEKSAYHELLPVIEQEFAAEIAKAQRLDRSAMDRAMQAAHEKRAHAIAEAVKA